MMTGVMAVLCQVVRVADAPTSGIDSNDTVKNRSIQPTLLTVFAIVVIAVSSVLVSTVDAQNMRQGCRAN